MKENKIQWVQTGLIIILGIMVLSMNAKLNNIKNTVDINQNSMNSLYGEISGISASIHQSEDDERLIQSYDYFVKNVNNDYTEALVDIELVFNEISQDADVYYTYRTISWMGGKFLSEGFESKDAPETEYGQWEQLQLLKGSDGSFVGSLSLTYDYNYEVKVVIETEEATISEMVQSMYLYEESLPGYDMDIQLYEYSSNGNYKYDFYLFQITDYNDINLESVVCEFYYDDKLIETVNIFSEGESLSHDENFREWTLNGQGQVEGGIDDINKLEAVVRITDDLGRSFTHNWKYY